MRKSLLFECHTNFVSAVLRGRQQIYSIPFESNFYSQPEGLDSRLSGCPSLMSST